MRRIAHGRAQPEQWLRLAGRAGRGWADGVLERVALWRWSGERVGEGNREAEQGDMKRKLNWLSTAGVMLAVGLAVVAGGTAQAGAIGRVVAIGGQASDLALDEARGVLYIANFTANRIEVMSLADGSIQTSMNVSAQPNSLALSADGRYLVVTHFGNFKAPATTGNNLTVIDLNNGNAKQTFTLGDAPLSVAFGIDNRALLVTTGGWISLDPSNGNTALIQTISGLAANTLPQPAANFPPNIVASAIGVSGDGMKIYGIIDAGATGGSSGGGTGSKNIEFVYDVSSRSMIGYLSTYSPPAGPRVVSVNQDGSRFLIAWGMNDTQFASVAEFPDPAGLLNIGSHVFDSGRGLVYAEIPKQAGNQGTTSTTEAPVLQILDAENLAVKDRLSLPEHLAGKSILSSDGSLMYSISQSGVLIVPIGLLSRVPRVAATKEALVFRGNFCERKPFSQEVTILDPGGGNTDFALSTDLKGVTITPMSGVTPATVRITVDPTVYQNTKGTISGKLFIDSGSAVNLAPPVRLLVNNKEPDQRGTFVNVPGVLVDLLADPARNRFYVLRQDTNQVLVFDSGNQAQVATLKTANQPTQLAVTYDRKYLLVGHNAAKIISVFDLDTLQPSQYIRMPGSHYPKSIAASANALLVANRVAGPTHVIDKVDFLSRTASELPTLGVFKNDINVDTALVASPNGSSVLVVQKDGTVLLYNANADTFTVSRKDFTALSGAYAASSFDQFVVGSTVLNASLVRTRDLETASGLSSGFAFVDTAGIRTTAPNNSAPGVVQRVDLAGGTALRSTRMVEAPVLSDLTVPGLVFTRTVAPLYDRSGIINLTTSGFTVLPWNYDAAVATPKIDRVVNAADGTQPVAPGGLVTIFGSNLSPVNLASQQVPLPTALGESCLTVNGQPLPVVFVSPGQINGQLPLQADGNVQMVLRTPGGVSDNFNLTILPTAPSVFRTGQAGDQSNLPTVTRAYNGLLVTPSNPIHRGDTITIYLTGMGRTAPSVDPGYPAPSDPLASTLIAPAVTLGGVNTSVRFAGLAPGQIGVYQINVVVPANVPVGLEVPLTIVQGGSSTSLTVRVVE